MPILNHKPSLPDYPITDATVVAWVKDELDGSPVVPNRELARECALALLNAKRAEKGIEPLKRCPTDAVDTALSYMEAAAADGEFGDAGKAKKAPKRKMRVEEDDEEEPEDEPVDDLEEEDDEPKSVIKRKYKERYRPHRMTNGDDTARLVGEHVKFKDEDGKMRVDQEKLEHFAKRNGCWDERYRRLNGGMRRMNIVNRLRAKLRKGHEIIWN